MKSRACLAAFLLLSLSAGADELLTNGDFEDVKDPLGGWTVSVEGATVDVNRIGSDWIPIEVRFNSGPHDQALLVIGAYGTPGGRCWIDNVRAEGFEVVNGSFEDEVSFLPLPDEAPKRNWRILPPPKPGGWFKDYDGTHHAGDRASDGKRSAMLSDPAMATGMIRIWQAVEVKPNTDYSYTFDFFMSEDFSGSVSCSALSVEFDLPGKYHHMGGVRSVGGVEGLGVGDLVADRAAAGYQQCRMKLEGGSAVLSRSVKVPAGVHLEAGVNVKASQLDGKVTVFILDGDGDARLAETSAGDTKGLWESVRLSFVSRSDRIRIQITGAGRGDVLLDGVYVSTPRLRPMVQSVTWGSASEDFVLPVTLGYRIEGDSGEVLETGLGILRKDLEAVGVELVESAGGAAALEIATNGDAPDHGEEAYGLDVTREGIRIRAATERGAFYGMMTLLQLLATDARGKPAVIACAIDDWPDLPWRALNRGAPGLTPEWLARRKANVAFHINEKEIPEWRRHGIEPIPHDNITHYPYNNPSVPEALRDPNYAEGMGRTDELTLVAETPAELSGRNVVRTKLTDIVVASDDGKITYKEGRDYRVIPGELKMSRRSQTSVEQDGKPFAIARIAGGRIDDGDRVHVTYEHVAPSCGELCLAELAPQKVIAQRAKDMVRRGSLPFVGLHVSESPRCVGKGPRCKATGLTPSELIARFYRLLDEAVKEVNPECRIITHADDFLSWQHTARSGMTEAAAMLPKDTILSAWHYGAGDSVAYAYKTAKLSEEQGLAFFLVPMYDYWNIHVFAAAAKWSREKGIDCLGLSDWAYHLGPYAKLKAPAPFIEEALVCAWRVPRKGERGYVDFEGEVAKIADQLKGR